MLTARPAESEHPGAEINQQLQKVYENSLFNRTQGYFTFFLTYLNCL
jgi:hypothetical protein